MHAGDGELARTRTRLGTVSACFELSSQYALTQHPCL